MSVRVERRKPYNISPWIYGAVVWGCLSLVFLKEVYRVHHGLYLEEMSYLISLPWFMFTYASLFSAFRKGTLTASLRPLLYVAFVPPLLLYIMVNLLFG